MEKVLVGIVTKPQALKGEFRVKPMIINMKQFKKLESITMNNQDYQIEKVTLRDSFVILKVKGVENCESAELLRNSEVFALIEVDKNDSFDLVGFNVLIEKNIIGKIVSVDNYGSKDIVSVHGNKSCMFPLIDDIVVSTDEINQEIILDKDLFEQVVVYEN